MRPYLIILYLLILTFSVSGQNWKRGLAIAGYYTATVALGAVGDGLYDNGQKEWAHALHAAEVGALIGGPFVFNIHRNDAVNYILSYGFLRFSFFDSFYNMTRDLPLLYNGTTSGYDRVMSKMPEHGRAWYKSISLVVGVAIPINHLRDG